MEINKQLFEDVLSGKMKGTFIFRNQLTCNSDELTLTCNSDKLTRNTIDKLKFMYPYSIRSWSYTSSGICHVWWDSNTDIVDFIPDTNMKENELTIEIPKGKIVDWDESKKQNKIVLKDKQLTYRDICEKLFSDKLYYISSLGLINHLDKPCIDTKTELHNATTEHQLECILAKNKLANVAKYLNDGWKPNESDFGYFICVCDKICEINRRNHYKFNNNVIFKSVGLAQQAIEILGEETIKLALEPLGI